MINPCIFQEGGDSEDDDYEEHTMTTLGCTALP